MNFNLPFVVGTFGEVSLNDEHSQEESIATSFPSQKLYGGGMSCRTLV